MRADEAIRLCFSVSLSLCLGPRLCLSRVLALLHAWCSLIVAQRADEATAPYVHETRATHVRPPPALRAPGPTPEGAPVS